MNDVMDRELGWDEEIEKENDFVLLPEGNYDFKVIKFDRARHTGSEKLPPCNKAVVTIEIDSPEGTATIAHNIFLHTKTEGLISAFFSAIGRKKKGEKIQMNWNAIVGATGRCKVGQRPWQTQQGEDRVSNEIKKFYPKEENAPGSPTTSYTAGKF